MVPAKLSSARSTTARLPCWLTCSFTGWVSTKRKRLAVGIGVTAGDDLGHGGDDGGGIDVGLVG